MIVKKIYKEMLVVDNIKADDVPDVVKKLGDAYGEAATVEYHYQEDRFWASVEKFHSDTTWVDTDSVDKIEEVFFEEVFYE